MISRALTVLTLKKVDCVTAERHDAELLIIRMTSEKAPPMTGTVNRTLPAGCDMATGSWSSSGMNVRTRCGLMTIHRSTVAMYAQTWYVPIVGTVTVQFDGKVRLM